MQGLKAIKLPMRHCAVAYADHIRLLITIRPIGFSANVLIGHAPRSTKSFQERAEWWQRSFERIKVSTLDAVLLMACFDSTSHIGSFGSNGGSLHGDDEDGKRGFSI